MKNRNIDSEILNKYINNKQSQITYLDNIKNDLESRIKKEKENIEKNIRKLEKLKFENSLIQDKYNSLYRIVKERGVNICIRNHSFNISEWDNLFIKSYKNKNIIISKKGLELEELDLKISNVFYREIQSNLYSLIVTRVDKRFIKVKFLIKDKNKSIL
ncbi:hypothetical protein OW763_08260 [Clostridium aestuarii]|uniref:Uncharacterized protein n=1 Tax=Clostridium aestuarii TaxID=338193 RepID=A0ABT4CZE0_9CLOT|nr:hypothetical protein [Clostridium aestuarii]MCY6484349.1 hypothetical protein [Clostridium aestuarii]